MALSVEKKVGVFFIAGLIVLGVMLEIGEKWNPFEKRGYSEQNVEISTIYNLIQ